MSVASPTRGGGLQNSSTTEDDDVRSSRLMSSEDEVGAAISNRYSQSCSLNFTEAVPDGFYAPWGDYPEVWDEDADGDGGDGASGAGERERRLPPLALLESIEPDVSDQARPILR
jgi:hypothetical protein